MVMLCVVLFPALVVCRGLDLVEHEEGIPKKQAALNRKKCTEPGTGTALPLPTVKCKAKDFDEYNADVLSIFSAHSEECLYCRERNHEAIENAQHAAQAANKQHSDEEAKKKHEEEEEERHRLEEEERHRLEEERLKHALEEEEAHRKAEEEAEAHRLEEEAAKKKHDEEVAALEEAARLRAEEAAKKAAEEAARREAEEAARLAAQEEERKKALAAAEDEARRLALEEQHRLEEEARQKALEEEARRLAEEAANKEEDEDAKMMRIIKEEEAERRRIADEKAREKKRIALGQHKYLKKHDGVLAASQSGACYQDKKADERAKEDMANMSIAHAKQEKLIKQHHQVGGETFHDSHTSKVVMVEVDVDEDSPTGEENLAPTES